MSRSVDSISRLWVGHPTNFQVTILIVYHWVLSEKIHHVNKNSYFPCMNMNELQNFIMCCHFWPKYLHGPWRKDPPNSLLYLQHLQPALHILSLEQHGVPVVILTLSHWPWAWRQHTPPRHWQQPHLNVVPTNGVPGGGEGPGFKPPQNSKGPPKSCQTQPDCENC